MSDGIWYLDLISTFRLVSGVLGFPVVYRSYRYTVNYSWITGIPFQNFGIKKPLCRISVVNTDDTDIICYTVVHPKKKAPHSYEWKSTEQGRVVNRSDTLVQHIFISFKDVTENIQSHVEGNRLYFFVFYIFFCCTY